MYNLMLIWVHYDREKEARPGGYSPGNQTQHPPQVQCWREDPYRPRGIYRHRRILQLQWRCLPSGRVHQNYRGLRPAWTPHIPWPLHSPYIFTSWSLQAVSRLLFSRLLILGRSTLFRRILLPPPPWDWSRHCWQYRAKILHKGFEIPIWVRLLRLMF